jgi:hypothetical protein
MAYEIEQGGITDLLNDSNIDPIVQAALLESLDEVSEHSSNASIVPTGTEVAVHSGDGEVTNVPDTVSMVILQGSNVVFSGGGDDDRIIHAVNGDNTITLTGTGNIIVTTGDGDDQVSTGSGGDTLALGAGSDTVDAGAGVDVVRISDNLTDVTVTVAADGAILVTTNTALAQSTAAASDSATADVKNISNAEVIEFADGGIVIAVEGNNDATVGRLYEIAFNRKLDIEGFRYWMEAENAGMSLDEMGDRFVDSAEYEAIYGGMTDAEFIDAVYQNLFNRAADSVGSAFWEDKLSSTNFTRGQMLAAFAYSDEAQNTEFDGTMIVVVGSSGDGTA